ncbi:gamma-glutamyl kinase [Thetidibacter halocola]|uniref:Gamma-glutamyl kinase n=1 Tax=Thetidibacter halocola TaxID=2827239 RepID=A0A8J7W836_9RHOB|nr:gamma-glutamyl kinase [Thetidibacter halocola]MBS0122647.1 gamma-glutamyl kinase [Thetidibacter halocola]
MMIFWKARLVFLAVPKTGTTAYQAALGPLAAITVADPPELKHAPVYRYNRFFRPMMEKMGADDMDILAVIREPVSWLGSWYRYRQRSFLDGKAVSTRDISFDDFCRAWAGERRPAFADVGDQSKFVEARPNGVAVTHLFQYEDQARLLGFLEERLCTRIDLPRENVSPRRDLALTPETEALLHKTRAAEFELWLRAGA